MKPQAFIRTTILCTSLMGLVVYSLSLTFMTMNMQHEQKGQAEGMVVCCHMAETQILTGCISWQLCFHHVCFIKSIVMESDYQTMHLS